MRFGRLAVLSALLASSFVASGDAVAKPKGQGTPPASSDPARVPINQGINNRNNVDGAPGTARNNGVKTVNPTYGPNGPGPASGWERTHQPRNLGTWNSDPIVAQRDNGKFYDARTGSNRQRGTLGVATAADANERAGYYDQSNSVNVWQGKTDRAEANVWKGTAGEYNEQTGNGAKVEACALCAQAEAGGSAGITGNGVQASGNFRAGAYLARVEGQAGAKYNGDVVQAGVNAQGSAMVGAEVKGTGTVEISRERITANGKIGAFAGGRAEGQIGGEVGLTNVGTVKGTVMGEVSYGIGASAEGYFTVDWSTWTIKTGGRASATLGIGAGVGFQTEISVKPAVDWVVNNAGAAYNTVASGVSTATSAVGNAASWVGNKLCFWCDPPAPPPVAVIPPQQSLQVANQTPLNTPTTPTAGEIPAATGIQSDGDAGNASGAGQSGALGRD